MALLCPRAALCENPRSVPSQVSCSPLSSLAPSFEVRLPHLTKAQMHPVSATASSQSGSSVESLADVGIFKATGEFVLFKDLWDQNEGIAVVALLRHFGCICCWELASALKEVKPKLDTSGVKLIAIGVGPPEKACMLAERLPFPLDSLYADRDRKAYKLLGLYYGFGRTFFSRANIKLFSRFDSLKKVWKNYTITATPDDRSSILQQGGMFVFKGNQLLYSRKDEGTGDHAPLDEVLKICCGSTSNA